MLVDGVVTGLVRRHSFISEHFVDHLTMNQQLLSELTVYHRH